MRWLEGEGRVGLCDGVCEAERTKALCFLF